MKKVFVNVDLKDYQKKILEDVSDQYEFVYKGDSNIYDSQIIVGNVPESELKKFNDLELFLLSAVGYDNYIKKGVLNDNTILCNAVDVHSVEVSEHIVALLLDLLKNLNLYRDNQKAHIWKDEGVVKSYSGSKVAIIGFGSIGRHLAKLLKGLGMYVIGVKQTMIDKPDYLDELYTKDSLNKVISDVDAVISVLPGTKENEHLFTYDTFKNMKNDTIFINAGRGNLYKNEDLIKALKMGEIRAAAADVFDVEPLNSDSEYYDLPNFVVTPHIAGFFHLNEAKDSFVELIRDNLTRYINNQELRYVVTQREK